MAVAPDPAAARVYVAGWHAAGPGGLAVVDLETGTVTAFLSSFWFSGENPEMVFDAPGRVLYVVFGDNLGSFSLSPEDLAPIPALRFTLMP
jgi:hypothetical protein